MCTTELHIGLLSKQHPRIEEELTALVDAYSEYLGLVSSSSSAAYVDLNSTQLINRIVYTPGGGFIALSESVITELQEA